jgi:hypothetical protein
MNPAAGTAESLLKQAACGLSARFRSRRSARAYDDAPPLFVILKEPLHCRVPRSESVAASEESGRGSRGASQRDRPLGLQGRSFVPRQSPDAPTSTVRRCTQDDNVGGRACSTHRRSPPFSSLRCSPALRCSAVLRASAPLRDHSGTAVERRRIGMR